MDQHLRGPATFQPLYDRAAVAGHVLRSEVRDAELPLPRPDFIALPIAQTDQQHARRVDARR